MSETFRSARPAPDEYNPYYGLYINRVPEGDIVDTMSRQIAETTALVRGLPESVGDHRYAPEKWTVREVLGHMTDCERVFTYRALRFSRGDATPLPGFDENDYVRAAPFPHISLTDLIGEFEYLRRATTYLFKNLDEAALVRRGTANGNGISVRALAYVIAGHESHHVEILRTRYL